MKVLAFVLIAACAAAPLENTNLLVLSEGRSLTITVPEGSFYDEAAGKITECTTTGGENQFKSAECSLTSDAAFSDCSTGGEGQVKTGDCSASADATFTDFLKHKGNVQNFNTGSGVNTFSNLEGNDGIIMGGPITNAGGHSAVIRFKNDGGWKATIREPFCLDDVHPASEDFGWFVVHDTQGQPADMGNAWVTTGTAQVTANGGDQTMTVTMGSGGTPKCLLTLQSFGSDNLDHQYVQARVKSISGSTVTVRLECSDGQSCSGAQETVGYLCWGSTGMNQVDTVGPLKCGLFHQNTNNDQVDIGSNADLNANSNVVVASIHSINGGDPVHLRRLNGQSHKYTMEEDTCGNKGDSHPMDEDVVVCSAGAP